MQEILKDLLVDLKQCTKFSELRSNLYSKKSFSKKLVTTQQKLKPALSLSSLILKKGSHMDLCQERRPATAGLLTRTQHRSGIPSHSLRTDSRVSMYNTQLSTSFYVVFCICASLYNKKEMKLTIILSITEGPQPTIK